LIVILVYISRDLLNREREDSIFSTILIVDIVVLDISRESFEMIELLIIILLYIRSYYSNLWLAEFFERNISLTYYRVMKLNLLESKNLLALLLSILLSNSKLIVSISEFIKPTALISGALLVFSS
jgi:hypothetical protein